MSDPYPAHAERIGHSQAVETLPMTESGHCVTVYDIRTGNFVGHGGYTVGGLPPIGSVVLLASVRAELVV